MDDEPPYQINFAASRVEAGLPSNDLLRAAVIAALRLHGAATAELSFVLTDDDEIARLNSDYLSHEGPTDVLSFDLRDDRAGDGHVEGEIVISVETAIRQAAVRGHSVDAEAALYAIHGVLHLLGYEDGNPDEAARMHDTEDRILSSIGLGPIFDVDAEVSTADCRPVLPGRLNEKKLK